MVIEPQPIQHPAWFIRARCTATPAAATVPAHRVGEIGQALVDLAAQGSTDQQREIDHHLTRLRTEAA